MAYALTLDTALPQVLVHYPQDAGGLTWHHRVLLKRIQGSLWITLTPDLGFQRHDLLEQEHEVLERRAPFPQHIVPNSIYAHDPLAHAVLMGFKRRAAIQANILGEDGDAMDVERQVWVNAEKGSPKFGDIVEDDLLDDPDNAVSLGPKGIVNLDGVMTFVQRVSFSDLESWRREELAALSDVRLLGDVVTAGGRRALGLADALGRAHDTRPNDFPLAGDLAAGEFLRAVTEGPGNLSTYHAEWVRLSGISEGAAVTHNHRNICEILRLMHSFDQIDVTSLASGELLTRWLVQTEVATERNPRHPDYSGLDIVISAPVTATGRAALSKFNSWVTDRMRDRAQIWKQERLFREERGKLGYKDSHGGDHDGGGGGKEGGGGRQKKGDKNKSKGDGDGKGGPKTAPQLDEPPLGSRRAEDMGHLCLYRRRLPASRPLQHGSLRRRLAGPQTRGSFPVALGLRRLR